MNALLPNVGMVKNIVASQAFKVGLQHSRDLPNAASLELEAVLEFLGFRK